MNNIIVILAGGKGSRYNISTPKQYDLVNGKELIEYSISEMLKSKSVDKILVVLDNDPTNMERIKKKFDVEVTCGGDSRASSFQNAIDFVSWKYGGCKKIVFHEAARPLIKSSIIDEYFHLLDEYDYVESCKRINDSLGSYVVEAPRREDYYLIQAPEAYRFSILTQYFDYKSDIYFAANQFPVFVKGYQYFDIPFNIKLTTQEDKVLVEYLLKHMNDAEAEWYCE